MKSLVASAQKYSIAMAIAWLHSDQDAKCVCPPTPSSISHCRQHYIEIGAPVRCGLRCIDAVVCTSGHQNTFPGRMIQLMCTSR